MDIINLIMYAYLSIDLKNYNKFHDYQNDLQFVTFLNKYTNKI